MNKKVFFRLIFYITGTFVVLTMVSIMGVNFIKDSRLLAKSISSNEGVKNTPAPAPVKAKKNDVSPTPSGGTYVYKREPIIAPKPVATVAPSNTPVVLQGTPKLETPTLGTPGVSPTPSPSQSPSVPQGSGVTHTPAGSTVPAVVPVSVQAVKVMLYNYSTKSDLTEKVRQELLANGFEVNAFSDSTKAIGRSEIIFSSNNPEAQKIRSLIKSAKVSTQIDPATKFDITVIIGDDYN